MSRFLQQKKKLISDVYEKAKKNTLETSTSGVLKDLEHKLLDDFSIQLSYKSVETYYKFLVEKNEDYNIKPVILNDLSKYLGYENFKIFCDKNHFLSQSSTVNVSIDGESETSTKTFSDIIINITNSPIFTMPEFVSKYKNGFGIVGLIIIMGVFIKKIDYFQENKSNQMTSIVDSSFNDNSLQDHKKDCMYWNGESYTTIFCDQKVASVQVEQLDVDKLKLKKITQPDTLTIDNALGRVWYDKKNNKVEFFTHHGIDPDNGKTLKAVTVYILEKY